MSDDEEGKIIYAGPQQPAPGFTPKDQDPVPEITVDDLIKAKKALDEAEMFEIPATYWDWGVPDSTIDKPDEQTYLSMPKDDRWSYYNEYVQVKKDIELEKIDYGKLSDKFKKNDKKDLTKEEKDAILNKIVWSED